MTPLSLRHDDPAVWMLMLKALLIAAILLAATYAALRWYSRRQGSPHHRADPAALHCIAVLRLSSGNRVYLLRANQTELLLTESVSGSGITLLPASPLPSQPPSR